MSSTGDFSAILTGLSNSTLYHFRAKALGYFTKYGGDQTFTTATTLGDTTVYTTKKKAENNKLYAADKFITTTQLSITQFVIYQNKAPATGNKFHVGLYSGTTPTTLVKDFGELTLSNSTGWVTYNVSSYNLPMGTYWIALLFSNDIGDYLEEGNITGYSIYKDGQSYGPLPATGPTNIAGEKGPVSMYFIGY